MRCRAWIFALMTIGVALQLGQLGASQSGQPATPVKQNPFAGSWTANLSKSKLHPSYHFQSTTLQIAVTGDTVTMASVLVKPSGQELRAAETFWTDGRETSGTLTPGIVLAARWVGTHVLATVAEKAGQVIALVTYEVSADGRTLTARSSGMLEQTIVFDRN